MPLKRIDTDDDSLFDETQQMLGGEPENWQDQVLEVTESATDLTLRGDKVVMEALDYHFAYRPEGYWRSDRYALFKRSKGAKGWDGFVRPLKRPFPSKGIIQRGYLQDVRKWCAERKVEVSGKLLPRPFAALTADDVPANILQAEWELDAQQRTCVAALLAACIGRVKVTVSGGKTAIACACAAMIKQRFPKAKFMYLAPTERLVNQVTKEAKKFLPDWDISQYGGNVVKAGAKDTRKDGKDMVVVTNAILGKNFDELVNSGWLKSFWCLLLDECHHATSDTLQKVLAESSAFFRLGMSDTTKEDDISASSSLMGLCGPILETVTAEAYIKTGRIAKPYIYVVRREEWRNKFQDIPYVAETGTKAWAYMDKQWHQGEYCGPSYLLDEKGNLALDRKNQPIQKPGVHLIKISGEEWEIESRWCLLERVKDKAIITFKERNEQIAAWSEHYSGRGMPTLVVATRTMHVLLLQQLIGKRVDPALVRNLFSDHSTGQRNKTFDWLRATPGSILITPLVKEGVSINEIRGMVVGDHVADWELMNQLIGRSIRSKQTDNWSEITIFDDIQHPTMRCNVRNIVRKLRELGGYEFYDGVRDPGNYKDADHYEQTVFTM